MSHPSFSALREKCAVFGIWGDPEASWMTYLGLYAQQHRGQEGSGIVSLDQGKHLIHRGTGLVGEVFNQKTLKHLRGLASIGHNRYSTRGGDRKKNIQPLTAKLSRGPVAVSHNGHIVNFPKLKKDLMEKGNLFYSTSDTECLIHLMAQNTNESVGEWIRESVSMLEGAYSLVILTKDFMAAVRDPFGFRPLVLGKKKWEDPKGNTGESWVVASETCAFDLIGAKLEREIQAGEIWMVNSNNQTQSLFLPKAKSLKKCVFEHVYFARPDSRVFGQNVYQNRKTMGHILAEEKHTKADVVIPIPDSGVPAAMGFSEKSGIPYEMGIVRNHYVGRTFIHPSQSIRDFKVKIKLSVQKHLIAGKKVVVVDDSLVRGTTSLSVIKMLRQAGAKEIHFRISSPPVISPCFYGVDTPEKKHLIAAQMSVEEIKNYLQVESLVFLSESGLMKAVEGSSVEKNSFCSSCFTGQYPTKLY